MWLLSDEPLLDKLPPFIHQLGKDSIIVCTVQYYPWIFIFLLVSLTNTRFPRSSKCFNWAVRHHNPRELSASNAGLMLNNMQRHRLNIWNQRLPISCSDHLFIARGRVGAYDESATALVWWSLDALSANKHDTLIQGWLNVAFGQH